MPRFFLLVGLALVLVSCSPLQDERATLQQEARRQFESAWEAGNSDVTQLEMTSSAGKLMGIAESFLYRAAALRLRLSPKESESTLEDLYDLGRITELIFADSFENTGSAEPMLRYHWIADLIMRQVEIFLAPPEIYTLWQRVRSAEGVLHKQPFSLSNGRSYMHQNFTDTFDSDEILLSPELCFIYRGKDYAIMKVDKPKSMTFETYGTYLVKISENKIEILESFGAFPVESIKRKNDQLFLQDGLKPKDKTESKVVNLNKL